MAQLIVPISSYANGAAPDFTNPIATAGNALTVGGTAPNKVLTLSGGTTGTHIFAYTPVAGVDDIEILTKFVFASDVGKQGIVSLRYSGNSEATTKGYTLSGSIISSIGQLAIDEGSTGYMVWTPWNYLPNVVYWVRFRVVGNSMKAKVWTDGSAEPGWMLDTTNGVQTDGAFSGLHQYRGANVEYRFVSFGTNGDVAPSITPTMVDVAQAQNLESVILTQKHSLVVNDISQAHGLDVAGDLIHNIALQPADLLQAHLLESPEVMPEGIVFPDDLTHSQALESPTLTQKHVLTVNDVAQAHSLEAPTVVRGDTLVVADIQQTQSVDNINLTQKHLLAVSDVSQAHTLESSGLVQRHVLAPADVSHAQFIETPFITTPVRLAIQDLRHLQFLDGGFSLPVKVHDKAPGVNVRVPTREVANINNSAGGMAYRNIRPMVQGGSNKRPSVGT